MPAVGDMITVRLVGSLDGQPIINNFSFEMVAAFGTWTELGTAMLGEMDAALGIVSGDTGVWSAFRALSYALAAFEVVDVSPGTSPLFSAGIGAVGAVDGQALPPNDALACTLRSDFKGASGRGRIYLAGFSVATVVSGFFTADAQGAANDIMAAMITGFGEGAGAASARWAVLHRIAAGVPVVPPEVKPIMGYTVHNEVRSLSRRAMGRRISRRTAPPGP